MRTFVCACPHPSCVGGGRPLDSAAYAESASKAWWVVDEESAQAAILALVAQTLLWDPNLAVRKWHSDHRNKLVIAGGRLLS